MKTNFKPVSLFTVIGMTAVVLLSSCEPNTDNPNDQEVITSVVITCTSPSDTVSFGYSDPDGDGGNVPTIDTAFLTASTVYTASIEVLDETQNPVHDLTHHIEDEGDEHQFFFTFTNANITSAYADTDINGDPIGLVNTWTTGTASSGSIQVVLKHQPGGIKDGNSSTGETDISVTFPVIIP